MFSLINKQPREMSIEEKILAMTEHTIRNDLPDKLRETGLFSEDDIARAIDWLIEYRAHHHLDIIE